MPKQAFANNDIVLAEDKGRQYEAKILKVVNCNNCWKYFIHYTGWAPHTDAWVDEEKLAIYDPAGFTGKKFRLGVPIKKNLPPIDSIESENLKKKEKTQISEEELTRKRKLKSLMENEIIDYEQDFSSSKISIPSNLKVHLVDEWDYLTQNPKKLLKLPREIHIQSIIEEFLEQKIKKADREQYKRYQELFSGLRNYFDRALPKILLYRQERHQWDQIKKLNLPPCQIYGSEHLLRLYVQFPKLLSQVSLQSSELNQMQAKLVELLNYILKNIDRLFDKSLYIPCAEALEHLEGILISKSQLD